MSFLDELAGFQENWKTNAENVLSGWSDGFGLLENAGTLLKLFVHIFCFILLVRIGSHSEL